MQEEQEFDRRRETILRLAIREADSRRRGRRVGAALGVLVTGVIAWAVIWMQQPATVSQHAVVAPVERQSEATFVFLQTDPTIVERLSLRPAPPTWRTIDDDEMLQMMADAGKPSGLIYVNDRAMLLPR